MIIDLIVNTARSKRENWLVMTPEEFFGTLQLNVRYNQSIPPLMHTIIAHELVRRLPPKEKTPFEHALPPRYYRIVIRGSIGKWEVVELYGIRRWGEKTMWDYFDGYWSNWCTIAILDVLHRYITDGFLELLDYAKWEAKLIKLFPLNKLFMF